MAAGSVLLVDTYELLASLDDWLRHTLLPQLPARSLVVIAGRERGSHGAWRTDVAWAALTRIHHWATSIRSEPDLSHVVRRSAEHHDEAMAFTRGHPWRCRSSADVLTRGDRLTRRVSTTSRRSFGLLLETFVRDVPSREHRLALHTCVSAWARPNRCSPPCSSGRTRTTSSNGSHTCRSSSTGPTGSSRTISRGTLSTGISAGEIRTARFRVTERVLGYLYERLERTHGLDRQRVWFDVLYVQRYNPCLRPYFEWAGFGTRTPRRRTHGNTRRLSTWSSATRACVRQTIARYWLTRKPEAFRAIAAWRRLDRVRRSPASRAATPEDMAADPAVALAVAYAGRHGPPRRVNTLCTGASGWIRNDTMR
jgi:hypothetical protein